MNQPTDDELRQWWRDQGGTMYGPKVEHWDMTEEKALLLMRKLLASPAVIKEMGDAGLDMAWNIHCDHFEKAKRFFKAHNAAMEVGLVPGREIERILSSFKAAGARFDMPLTVPPDPDVKGSLAGNIHALRGSKCVCPNCKGEGPHFVPPSLGEPGFFTCDVKARGPAPARVEPCPECGGRSLHYIGCPSHDRPLGVAAPLVEPCPECGGKGLVMAPGGTIPCPRGCSVDA